VTFRLAGEAGDGQTNRGAASDASLLAYSMQRARYGGRIEWKGAGWQCNDRHCWGAKPTSF